MIPSSEPRDFHDDDEGDAQHQRDHDSHTDALGCRRCPVGNDVSPGTDDQGSKQHDEQRRE